jgi:hypothetical protein
MQTAFQRSAFQNNAFQIAKRGGGLAQGDYAEKKREERIRKDDEDIFQIAATIISALTRH